jgi:hypothetical protein
LNPSFLQASPLHSQKFGLKKENEHGHNKRFKSMPNA